jgi:tetratricopeptide (TPR) repeat protein
MWRVRVRGGAGLLLPLLMASGAGAAPPRAIPAMVGSSGTDADGYPLRTVDKRAVLRMLRARQFDALDAWLVDLQSQFEADYHKEYWPQDALDAFANVDPALEPLLDAWVAAKPESYMALAARGIHNEAAGWHRRGGRWACETPPENFEQMREAHATAFPDLDDALARHANLVAVHRALIRIAKANGGSLELRRQLLDQALVACPECFQVRVTFIFALQPRWGGDYEKMRAFAAETASATANTKLRLLAGYVDSDRCSMLRHFGKRAEALDACNRALAVGESPDFYDERATLLRKSNPAAARADLDRALWLRPQRSDLVEARAAVLMRLRRFSDHARDVALLKEIDPIERLDPGDVQRAAQGLAYEAGRQRKAGSPADEVALLERAIALDPDDLDNHRRLDAALIRAGARDKIPAMWAKYLARHPKNARAHLELAGALHHLGRERDALAEAAAACRLGEQTGCQIAARGR